MNKQQKEVIQSQLNDEKELLKELRFIFGQAQDDAVNKIIDLSRRKDMENLQTIIYQQQYQQAITAQLTSVLEQLHSDEFATISNYLSTCYQSGYLGTMYDIAGQGIPIIAPIDQEAVVKAIQIDSKLSKSLYNRLGEDISELKKDIRMQVARGIANGSTWNEIGAQMAKGMKSTIDQYGFNKALNNSVRIARTEGHRIQNQSALDAQKAAKKKGADVLKQWNSTLDGHTRDTHRKLDGQIRELDEDFEVEGKNASAPGMFGDPAEDCNCRCALLQRARWALDEEELETLKERAEYFGLDKSKDFEDYKEKYIQVADSKNNNLAFNLQFFAESKEQIQKRNEFLKKLQNGNINMNLRTQKQNDHVEGTKERIRRIANDQEKGRTPSSEFYKDINISNIVIKYAGTGDLYFDVNNELPVEYVTVDRIVGKVYNVGKKEYVETDRVAISYSKKGVHLYPVKNW